MIGRDWYLKFYLKKEGFVKDILLFSEISKNDIPIVGGKAANLGEMNKFGIPVPKGFCLTSGAYFNFVKSNGIFDSIIKYIAV